MYSFFLTKIKLLMIQIIYVCLTVKFHFFEVRNNEKNHPYLFVE